MVKKKDNNTIQRVEQHQINKNHLMYKIWDELWFKSKNILLNGYLTNTQMNKK